MTERIYYRDATRLEFDATVIAQVGDALHVVLDRTAFYPTSGGQPHDTGTLGGVRVIDVIDDGRVVHVTDAPVPAGLVRGVVDGVRRRDHMQQHSAQHLLSALAADRLHWDTASVHFGADHSTIELTTTLVSRQQLATLERWANEVVAAACPVEVTFVDAAVTEQLDLRKPTARAGDVRIVTIAGIDRSACGGTHVSRTSEIGPVMLVGVEKVRDNSRVTFLAGDRVLTHARGHDRLLAELAGEVGCAVSELAALIPARQADLRAARDQATRLEQEVAGSRLHSLYAAAIPGPDGVRRITLRAGDESAVLLRAMAQRVGSLERTLFVAIGGVPAALYFATSSDSGIDAAARLKPVLAAEGGRGGGSARVAQGTAPSAQALERVADEVLRG